MPRAIQLLKFRFYKVIPGRCHGGNFDTKNAKLAYPISQKETGAKKETIANLRYPAKNDKFFAGERRNFPLIPKD